jgi:molybdenum cofactor cytidylyltransferase
MQLFFSNLLAELKKGTSVSFATLLSTKGSTPQVPGASAVFGKDTLLFGTLGGGALEADIQDKAFKALDSENDLVEEYHLDSQITDDAGAICGGYAMTLIDAHPRDHLSVLRKINASLKLNKSGILVTLIDRKSNHKKKIERYWFQDDEILESRSSKTYSDSQIDLKEVLQEGKPLLKEMEDSGQLIFYEPVFPDAQLIIVGAGHVGKALSHLGKLLDFRVIVIDDRPEHANKENIPDAYEIFSQDIESDLKNSNITENTYIVIVTQGHKKDAVALRQCIHSPAAYIGMIGSKRKTRLMKEDFIAKGWANEKDLDKIYAPIGIDIRSKTVQEIAISIAAQLIQVRQEKYAREKGQNIDIIILAAGKSERMGQQKLLMPYAGKSIIEHIVVKALESNAGQVHVVLGSHQDEIRGVIHQFPVKIVVNKEYEKGMLSSVQGGFNDLSPRAKAGVILLGDQPMVQTGVINKLIETYYKTGSGILVPVHKGKRGHPVLIDTKYTSEINALDPNIGLRQLMEKHTGDIHEMEVETNTILKDIDTIEDYNKELI